jgi:hypothetical protein
MLHCCICSVLAQHWRQLQSLHISYSALPESADTLLSCLGGFEALTNLSLYCFSQGGFAQRVSVKRGVFDQMAPQLSGVTAVLSAAVLFVACSLLS